MSTIKCWHDLRMFQFALAIHWQKNWEDSDKAFVYYISNGFSIPQYFVKGDN